MQLPESSNSQIALLTLNPILTRDPDKTARLRIGPQVTLARLRVSFDGQAYRNYRAILQTVEGAQVWQRTGLKTAGKSVILDIPASLLTETDYLLTLIGIPAQGEPDEIGKYSFRVVKK
jgi:hypothetical protein